MALFGPKLVRKIFLQSNKGVNRTMTIKRRKKPAKRRENPVKVFFAADERQRLKQHAEDIGLSLSAWIRRAALVLYRKERTAVTRSGTQS